MVIFQYNLYIFVWIIDGCLTNTVYAMVIFQYNLYIFVWILDGCLTNTVYAMDPNNSVVKR